MLPAKKYVGRPKPSSTSSIKTQHHGNDNTSKTTNKVSVSGRKNTEAKDVPTDSQDSKKEMEKKVFSRPRAIHTRTQATPSIKPFITTLRSETKPKLSEKSSSSKVSTSQTLLRTKRTPVPVTPPSTRVTKSKFFPTKNVYANALQQSKTEAILKAPQTKPDLKKSEVKDSKQRVTKDRHKSTSIKQTLVTPSPAVEKVKSSSVKIERPQTATIKKSSVVNQSYANDKVKPNVHSNEETEPLEEPDYEDDFDSYESDFEEYVSSDTTDIQDDSKTSLITDSSSSTNNNENLSPTLLKPASGLEEERTMDSGTFEITEYKHANLLDNIKESIENENANITVNNMASLSDEGFEETKSPYIEHIHFVNFADAQKKQLERKQAEKRNKRGRELLTMIRLDTYSFTLFESLPIAYDDFIKLYGKRGGLQVSSQTGDDDLEEETQTDDVVKKNKWTQAPISLSYYDTTNPNYIEQYKSDFLGVGSDTPQQLKLNNKLNNKEFSSRQLDKFLLNSGQLMLSLLEENAIYHLSKELQNSDVSFSSGYVEFNNTVLPFTANSSVVHICYTRDASKILTVHVKLTQPSEFTEGFRSVVYVWSISNPDVPEKILIAYSQITCCAFEINDNKVIIGASEDGSVCVWNTRNNFNYSNSTNELPAYFTDIGSGHTSKIISMKVFADAIEEKRNFTSYHRNISSQVCTLDEDGYMIVWGIIHKINKIEQTIQLHDVILVENIKVHLETVFSKIENALCTDMILNISNSNHAFISTTYGNILHISLATGTKLQPAKYTREARLSSVLCLAACPFSQLYFLAGFEDGSIGLYSRRTENALRITINKDIKIQQIEWSYVKPCIFYALDATSTIHAWNITISNISLMESVTFKEHISFFRLAPVNMQESTKPVVESYMMLGSNEGGIHLHLLNEDHGHSSFEDYEKGVNIFLSYVKRFE